LSEVLREKELSVEPDTEEAGRLAGSKDGSPVERKCVTKTLPKGEDLC
jgi:hypothetical protein